MNKSKEKNQMIQNLFEAVSTFFAGNTVMSLYWVLAIGGSLFFVLNLITASFGGVDNPAEVADDAVFESPDQFDAGFEVFHFLSLRAVLAFISVFGWSGVIWGKYGFWGFLAAFVFGLIAMSLTALAIWVMLKLQHSGNVKTDDFIGKTGTVYMQIPGGNGHGKVTVTINSSTREVTAISEEPIATGTPIKVVAVIDQSLFRVEKI